jgi:hypothetical protein
MSINEEEGMRLRQETGRKQAIILFVVSDEQLHLKKNRELQANR